MIEADPDIAGPCQRIGDRLGLSMPLEAIGQRGLVDLALVFLEARDMGIAEHRKAVRAQLDAFVDGVETRRDGLVRQSVDQIEIDAGDAGPPQAFGRGGGLLETLHPVDGALHGRIEALHAEARPVDAAEGKRLDHLPERVRGSISTAISAEGGMKKECRIDPIRSTKVSGAMMVGVPPPK